MARPRGPRRLSPEEAELWRRVVEHAAPLHPARRATGERADPRVKPEDHGAPPPPPVPIAPFAIAGRRTDTRITVNAAPSPGQALARQPLAMDAKAFGRMRRGKLPVEGRIDLHGMTLDQAQPTLAAFVLGAQAMGKRLVLVITGKGGTKRQREAGMHPHGVLKRQVPLWLRMPPLAGAVLQIAEAHASHGGSGAYYVYLRRGR